MHFPATLQPHYQGLSTRPWHVLVGRVTPAGHSRRVILQTTDDIWFSVPKNYFKYRMFISRNVMKKLLLKKKEKLISPQLQKDATWKVRLLSPSHHPGHKTVAPLQHPGEQIHVRPFYQDQSNLSHLNKKRNMENKVCRQLCNMIQRGPSHGRYCKYA